MSTIIKTVKQYSYELDEEMLKELLFIANQYKNVKTMFIQDTVELIVFYY